MIRMTSGMFHEPRLFTCGVELPLEHPVVYTALIDEDDYDFVLIMEDITARGPIHETPPGRCRLARSLPACAAWPGCTADTGANACTRSPPWTGSNPSCPGTACNSRPCTKRLAPSETT